MPARNERRFHHPDFDKMQARGWKAAEAEAKIGDTRWQQELKRGLEHGLPGADSIGDRSIPTFARGELPHFAGINTFLKAPYVENVREVGKYDAAIVGVPFDGGTTYRPGTRFGPQGMRRISALYTPYNYELGVDLREQMSLCDAGDVFTIPANLEKTFDQITRAVSHVFSSGAMPVILGGDHSIGFPTVRGIAQCTSSGSASCISTATPTSRRRISTSACTRRRGSMPPTCRTCRRSTWCRSALAAGRCRAKR